MSSPAPVVHPCGVGDAPSLRSIRLEALADTPEAYGSTYAEARGWSIDRWETMSRDWNFYLAEHQGRVVGMASGGLNDQRPGTRWLYGMYVAPDMRGTGVAGQLVGAVEQWARGEGVSSLYLHVTETLARARGFYERTGFCLTGDVIAMGRNPSLRLVTMVKNLE